MSPAVTSKPTLERRFLIGFSWSERPKPVTDHAPPGRRWNSHQEAQKAQKNKRFVRIYYPVLPCLTYRAKEPAASKSETNQYFCAFCAFLRQVNRGFWPEPCSWINHETHESHENRDGMCG
jgi:hypothetical protein